MALIKLTEPGAFHTLHVTTVSVDSGGKWPDYHLSDGTHTVVIPKSAADRQLERLKLASVFDLVQSTVKVSRSDKPGANGKHFWNLDITNKAESQPKASPRVSSPYVPTRAGPHIPELDDDPGPMDPDGPYEPAPTPREQREGAARSQRERDYLALWSRVATDLADICQRNEIPLDASAVQAATATIHIANQR